MPEDIVELDLCIEHVAEVTDYGLEFTQVVQRDGLLRSFYDHVIHW